LPQKHKHVTDCSAFHLTFSDVDLEAGAEAATVDGGTAGAVAETGSGNSGRGVAAETAGGDRGVRLGEGSTADVRRLEMKERRDRGRFISGNSCRKGCVSTIDHLIKIACFVKKNVFRRYKKELISTSWYKEINRTGLRKDFLFILTIFPLRSLPFNISNTYRIDS
jgi:hypothetical protein